MGDVPPTLTGIKFLNTPLNNEVLLEAGLTWAAGENFFLSMQATTTLGDVLVRVQDLKLAGTLRMTMKPFVRHPPFVSQLHFSFLGKPDLTFDTSNELMMTGISLSMPMLNQWIETSIHSALVEHMVIPASVAINLDHVWIVRPSVPCHLSPATVASQALSHDACANTKKAGRLGCWGPRVWLLRWLVADPSQYHLNPHSRPVSCVLVYNGLDACLHTVGVACPPERLTSLSSLSYADYPGAVTHRTRAAASRLFTCRQRGHTRQRGALLDMNSTCGRVG
jgi:hypothetical protein